MAGMPTTKTKSKTSKSSPSKSMDAITLLKHDHDEVKDLFSKFEKAKDSSKQLELAQQVCLELTIHAQIEEQSFYPEIKRLPEMEDMVMESLEEHRQVKEMVAKIKGLSAGDDHLEPDMKVLNEDVEHHVQEEEKDMFPQVKKGLGKDRLDRMGQTLMQQKQALKTQLQSTERRVTEPVKDEDMARR